jgi:hypothetical protein
MAGGEELAEALLQLGETVPVGGGEVVDVLTDSDTLSPGKDIGSLVSTTMMRGL